MSGSEGCVLVVDDSTVIRKIVARILERKGYRVLQAADGQIALDIMRGARAPQRVLDSGSLEDAQDGNVSEGTNAAIDLVLVDFVMPRMNGFQFCRALREDRTLPQPAIVLMSAKSERIRERFVEQTGALDAIAKPFDAEALTAVVENSIKRFRGGTASVPAGRLGVMQAPTSAAMTGDFEDDGPGATRVGSANLFVQRLTECLEDAFDLPQAELLARISDQITPAVEASLGQALNDTRSETVLSGSFSAIPIGSIFQIVQTEGFSGELSATRNKVSILTTFRDGLIDLVEGRGEVSEYRLGRFFVEDGSITAAELQATINQIKESSSPRPDSRLPLGELLLRAGKITRDQLGRALRRQSSELIYEMLRWKDGHFELRKFPTSLLAGTARLGLQAATLVMEGFRRLEDWQHIESTLGAFESPVYPDSALAGSAERLSLSRVEQYVLSLVDGERTIREILASSNLSTFETCRVLAGLLGTGFVRRKTT
jgi:CheY-like chemotaxis protein